MDVGQRGRFCIRDIGNGLAQQRLRGGPTVQSGQYLVDHQVAAIQVLEPDLERKIVKQGTRVLFALA